MTQLTNKIQSVSVDDAIEAQQPSTRLSQSRKKTLAEIKAEVRSQKDSSASFVIIGKLGIYSPLIECRARRCRKEYFDGQTFVRAARG